MQSIQRYRLYHIAFRKIDFMGKDLHRDRPPASKLIILLVSDLDRRVQSKKKFLSLLYRILEFFLNFQLFPENFQ